MALYSHPFHTNTTTLHMHVYMYATLDKHVCSARSMDNSNSSNAIRISHDERCAGVLGMLLDDLNPLVNGNLLSPQQQQLRVSPYTCIARPSFRKLVQGTTWCLQK